MKSNRFFVRLKDMLISRLLVAGIHCVGVFLMPEVFDAAICAGAVYFECKYMRF